MALKPSHSNSDDDFEEQIMVLQLNGVLDFEAVKRAAQNGIIRVRESNSETPLIQVGSSLYSGTWAQTIGTDLIFSIDENKVRQMEPSAMSNPETWYSAAKSRLELIALSDTKLSVNKVLLTTEECQENLEQTIINT